MGSLLHGGRFGGKKSGVISPQYLILAQLYILCVLAPRPAFAETLEVPVNEFKNFFDYSMPYRGQTFMLPASVKADRLTVYVAPIIYQSLTFILLVTEVDTVNGFHPTAILFESGPFYISREDTGRNIPYTADLGGLPLSGGKRYAFILDIFVSLRQIESATLWQYYTRTGMNAAAGYASGDYIYYSGDNNCTASDTGLPCGTREDHFAGSWTVGTSEDMGFRLEYTQAPPSFLPAVMELLLKGNPSLQ